MPIIVESILMLSSPTKPEFSNTFRLITDVSWGRGLKIVTLNSTYDESTDSAFTSGIIINNNLTIDGNGYTIDLGGK